MSSPGVGSSVQCHGVNWKELGAVEKNIPRGQKHLCKGPGATFRFRRPQVCELGLTERQEEPKDRLALALFFIFVF